MKILTVDKIREADQFTIENEPISSLNLMERASTQVAQWILKHFPKYYRPIIVAGKGNNGGDGLAIARMLAAFGYQTNVYVAMGTDGSEDFNTNLERLDNGRVDIIEGYQSLKERAIDKNVLWIDALFGSGLSRPIEGGLAELIDYMNKAEGKKITIDIPSGLFADKPTEGKSIFQADTTLSFQFPKLAFLIPENETYVGDWTILDIGLSREYIDQTESLFELTKHIKLTKASKFAHKGDRGRCTIIAGGYTRMGAAILAARAVLHSGIGLITVQSCQKTINVVQQSIPEALILKDCNEYSLGDFLEYGNQDVLVVGPALGFAEKTKKLFLEILKNYKGQLVLDADALTYLSENAELLQLLPKGTILTPHIGEFDRLFGKHDNHFDRLKKLQQKAKKHQIIILLKGKYSAIASPEGQIYFNSTGNNSMAKGGSGDVLAGMIGGMFPLTKNPLQTAINAAFLHGLSGDIATDTYDEDYVTPSILIENLHLAQKMCTQTQ